jgi:hypothetical protein
MGISCFKQPKLEAPYVWESRVLNNQNLGTQRNLDGLERLQDKSLTGHTANEGD